MQELKKYQESYQKFAQDMRMNRAAMEEKAKRKE
jgi:hypothetical protein